MPQWARTGLGLLLLSLPLNCTIEAAESCQPIRTFADGRQPLRQIFISPAGNDSSGDGSRARPFRTLNHALERVRPGDAIRLLPGTYAGGTFLGDLAGREEAPIWIGGEPGQERPVISGGSNALHLSRVRYLVIENLEITGSTSNGINCDDGGRYDDPEATHHLVFRNVVFREIGTGGNNDGLKLSGVYDYFVLDSEFRQISPGGSGIDHVGCHRGLIARCEFTENGNSIQCKGGSTDIEIRWNRFVDAGGRAINIGGSTGFAFFRPPLSPAEPNFESKNIRVIANLFRGSDAPVAFVGTVESLVANNTIINPDRWILRILQETVSNNAYTFLPSGHNRFINNLVYFSTAQVATLINIGPNTDPASFTFSHNFWYAWNAPGRSEPDLPSEEANGIYEIDPLFRDLAGEDYSVFPESLAIGKGLPLPEVVADIFERCYANPPTIGAIEANPPAKPRADADADGMPDGWEDDHLFDKMNPADALLDADGDLLLNYGEYLAGTDPRDEASAFALELPRLENGSLAFSYASEVDRIYTIESRGLLAAAEWNSNGSIPGDGEVWRGEFNAGEEPGQIFRVRIEGNFPVEN